MLPDLLLPYQKGWFRDQSAVRLAEKSRRIGWSWAAACEVTLKASMSSGCDAWYVGYNKDMAQEFVRDCAFWAHVYNTAATGVEESIFEDDDPDRKILTYSISFASGYRVTALSSRPTNLRGKRGHIIIDEAAFHDDLEGLIKAAIAVLMWGGKARVDVISTHNGTDNYFYKLTEEIRSGKRPWSLHKCTLDDALEQGLFKRICYVNGWEWSQEREAAWRKDLFSTYGDAADEELLCIPARSGGVYLNRDLIERQMREAPVLRCTLEDSFVNWSESARIGHFEQWCGQELLPLLKKLPKDLMHAFGQDFGRVSDRTVMAPVTVLQDLKRVFPFVVELANVPFDQQKQVAFYILDRLPNFTRGAFDATGNGAYLAEAAALKYNGADPENQVIEQIHMTDKWYAEQLPPFKAALEDRLCELVRDADHLMDLSALRVVNGIPKLPKTKTESTTGKPRHGDAAIAYALGHYASRLPVRDYGYTAVPKKEIKNQAGLGRGGFRGRSGIL